MAADVPTWQMTVKDTMEKINIMPVMLLCFGRDNKVKKAVNWSDNISATLARCRLGIWRCVIVILEILQAVCFMLMSIGTGYQAIMVMLQILASTVKILMLIVLFFAILLTEIKTTPCLEPEEEQPDMFAAQQIEDDFAAYRKYVLAGLDAGTRLTMQLAVFFALLSLGIGFLEYMGMLDTVASIVSILMLIMIFCAIVLTESKTSQQMTHTDFSSYSKYILAVSASLVVLGMVICLNIKIFNPPTLSDFVVVTAGIGGYAVYRKYNGNKLSSPIGNTTETKLPLQTPGCSDTVSSQFTMPHTMENKAVRGRKTFTCNSCPAFFENISDLAEHKNNHRAAESHMMPGRQYTRDFACSDAIELNLKAMKELDRLTRVFGLFSYYVDGSRVVVHTEDRKAIRNAKQLEVEISRIAQKCSNLTVTVTVFRKLSNAKLCSMGIGAQLNIEDTCPSSGSTIRNNIQTVGMYIQHEGAVYWMSVAHNYVTEARTRRSHNQQISENGLMHTGHPVSPKTCRWVWSMMKNGRVHQQKIRTSTPYACWFIQPLNRMGQFLCHSVDFMIGQVPLQAFTEEPLKNLKKNMYEVRGPCTKCGSYSCNHRERLKSEQRYAADGFYKFPKEVGGTFARYVAIELKNRELFCLIGNKKMIAGKVLTHQATVFVHQGSQQIPVVNALLIIPINESVAEVGDSGSVWVLERENKAVAMTVGMLPLEGTPVVAWIAQLLQPCFEAFCWAQQKAFPGIYQFASLDVND